MNIDDIICMAHEAGMQTVFSVIEEHQDGTQTVIDHRPFLERFANLVAAAEREACIEWLRNNYQDYKSISEICEAIRARGQI